VIEVVENQASTGGRAQLFRSIFEQNVIGIVLVDLDGTIIESNSTFRGMLGYTESELRHLRISQLTHPSDFPETAAFLRQAATSTSDSTSLVTEKRYLRKDGSTVWGRINATAIRDAQGTPIFSFAVVEDISERKAAEDRLAAEKERLAVTLRNIGDAVISTDTEGRITLFNKIAELLTGWRQEEAQGQPISDVLRLTGPHDHQPCVHPIIEAIRRDGRFETAAPLRLVARDGSERLIAGTGSRITDPASLPVGTVFAFRDVTGKARMEEEQARTEKLESLGYLAGGIAHDFNNLLTTILGNLSLARTEERAGGDLVDLLRQAEQAAIEAGNLTQQLLAFAKGGEPIKKIVAPGPLVRESAEFALRGSSSKLDLNLPDNLWSIDVDPNLIGQVIRQLVINADQAMPGGGRVLITMENSVVGSEAAYPLAPGHYVKVVVTDSGVGIPGQNLEKIFDPYFTTKQKGSGLGLAASLSVIRNHGGHIAVESRVGTGSSFSVYLPAASEPSKVVPAPDPAAAPPARPSVLVMDDEDSIRQLTTRILSRNGFRVETAVDGNDMLRQFVRARSRGEPFDVVILDLTIRGGMGGKEAMQKLLELEPSVQAIVSSGYSTDPIMANYRRFGFRAIVAKPYQPEYLVQTVRNVIGIKNA
jgi:PAS domain S-box-containing protein